VDRHSAGRGAALAGGAEATPDGAVHREVQLGVVHHHDDVLAAHLQVAVLEGRGAGLGDHAPDARGAREGDHLHVLVVHEGGADLAPASGDHVDDAPGKTGFLEGLD